MIAEAINRIQQLTRAAERIEHAPDFDDTGRYFIYHADESFTERFEERPPNSTRHYSTASLGRMVHDDLVVHGVAAEAFWNDERLTVAMDQAKDHYTFGWNHELQLRKHPAFIAVAQLTSTRAYSQKQLIHFLRAQLNGHVDDAVVEQFRTLKLSTDGATESVVVKGREAVDKRIQQQVRQTAGTDVPDQITVTIPVHDLDETRDELHDVVILVDTTTDDAGGIVLELTTVLNTLRAAERAALDSVVTNLRTALPDNVPIYHAVVR